MIYLFALLAVYRVARMLALEEGPFGIFAEIRGHIDPDQKTWLGRGLNCPLCEGVWIALAVTLILLPWDGWRMFLLTWLGLAGGMAALYLFTEHIEG